MVSRRGAEVALAVIVVPLVAVTACTSPPAGRGWGSSVSSRSSSSSSSSSSPAEVNASGESCVVAAAGDVAGEDDYRTGAARTAKLIAAEQPQRVLALGDLAYSDGTAAEFADYYDPTWGEFKSITAPAPGNHEYGSDGKGYFDYFDVAPNYAFDLC